MSQRAIVRLSSSGFGPFPRHRDERKAHDRDGRTAQRPDGPARASSPRPVIRGESPLPPFLLSGSRQHEVSWTAWSRRLSSDASGGGPPPSSPRPGAWRQAGQALGVHRGRSCRVPARALCWSSASVAS